MTRYYKRWLACLIVLPLAATAQVNVVPDWKMQPERGETVSEREPPELDPLGISIDGYYFYPRFSYTALHTDNVYATSTDTVSDLVSIYSPGLAIESDWTRHGFQLSGDASLGRYRDTTTEDYDDWQIAASGWLNATSNSRLLGVLTSANLHETRVSADDANGLNPTKFDVHNAFVNFEHREGRFVFTPSIDYRKFNYHDVKAVVLGRREELDQDYRDRDEYNLELKVAYQIGHQHDLFVRAGSNRRDYANPQILTGFDRSSDGYDAGAGFNFDFGGISHGKFYLGYHKQQYEDPMPDIDTPIYDILFNWEVTSLTSLQLGAERTVEETTALFDSGYVSSLMKFRVDHELRRNLFLYAAYSRIDDEYESIESNTREEQTDITSIGVKYLPNRNLVTSFRLENIKRDATNDILPPGVDEGDFETEIYWIRIEIRQ